jgi:hypothetical protein
VFIKEKVEETILPPISYMLSFQSCKKGSSFSITRKVRLSACVYSCRVKWCVCIRIYEPSGATTCINIYTKWCSCECVSYSPSTQGLHIPRNTRVMIILKQEVMMQVLHFTLLRVKQCVHVVHGLRAIQMGCHDWLHKRGQQRALVQMFVHSHCSFAVNVNGDPSKCRCMHI